MKPSIKDFAKNFQALEAAQLKNIVGGIGETVQPMAYDRRKKRNTL